MNKGKTEQSVLVGVFMAVCWGAAEFSDLHLGQEEFSLCLAPSAGSVAAGVSLQGIPLGMEKQKYFMQTLLQNRFICFKTV